MMIMWVISSMIIRSGVKKEKMNREIVWTKTYG